jgi:hypothetical protein
MTTSSSATIMILYHSVEVSFWSSIAFLIMDASFSADLLGSFMVFLLLFHTAMS